MRHGKFLFYGSREPCNNIQVPKADPLKAARHGGGIRFLNTKFPAAVGLKMWDGVSLNALHMSQILGIYYLVSQRLARAMWTRMFDSTRESHVFDGKVMVV